ncbi:MAG TPA: fused MFS/spermidine synthase [Fibrobacter sp.]|nr:fused MFS/spermidine synthase [Fibrobacter sp.]
MQYLIYLLFALSGVAGLIYEGSWARYLKFLLGHASYGQVLTLCIYMGGLAIGSFIAGKLVVKLKRPLRAYAITELFIGIGGLLYHPIYIQLTNFFYDSSWSMSLSVRGAETVKVFLAIGSTLPIAIGLGMTFPFIAAGLMRRDKDSGEISLPKLYFTNSLGAAIGILIASYLLIPSFGNQSTLNIAASINFFLAIAFWVIDSDSVVIAQNKRPKRASKAPAFVHETNRLPMPPKKIWFWIAAITGLTSFIYEVLWIRLLSLLMGSSSHSFDQMLSAFIFGLAIGSAASGKLIKKDHLILLSAAQILMGFFALCTLYFHEPFWMVMNQSNQIFNQTSAGYASWSIFKYILSVFWMVPTSFFAGMTLPLITIILTRAFKSESPIGKVYGFNTIGSILGSILAALILIPILQLKWTLATAALLDMAIGVLLLVIYRKKFRYSVLFYITIILMILPLSVMNFKPDVITSGIFRIYKALESDDSTIVRNGKTATISFHESEVHWYIKTNGKADASMSKNREVPIGGDELTQAATAFIPMAMRNEPYDAAMVGFGSGMGAHYLLSDPLLKKLDCIEIEEEMMNLAKGFMPYNERGYLDPRINIYIDDARTFFHTHKQKYDVIVSVPSNPWVSGVSSLFSHEFYSQMKRYLKPGAQWVQWIQTYEFNDLLFLHILKALHQSFNYVVLYQAPEEPDVIIIASDSPVRQQYINRFQTDSVIQKELARIQRPWYFFGEQNFLFTTEMISPILEKVSPNSEFMPMVDNKAEEARFIHSQVEIIRAFDSCEVCWPEVLDSNDYAPRQAFKNLVKKLQPQDEYLKRSLIAHLQDTAFISLAKAEPFHKDWLEFVNDYNIYIHSIPLEERDSSYIYNLLKAKVYTDSMPEAQALEFKMMESMRLKRYTEAAENLNALVEAFEIKEMEEFFLRNAVIVCVRAKEFKLLEFIYKEAIRNNEDFSAPEKVLIEITIKKQR